MAQQRNRLMDILSEPSTADVLARTEVARGDVLPLVQYGDGRFELGVPGYAQAAGNAVNSILQAVYDDPMSIVRQPIESGAELLWGGAKDAAMSGDPEAMKRASGQALDFASLIPVGSVAAHAAGGVPSNSLGIFGGRMAKTADHAALSKAEQMAAQGVPREQIWSETGWFQAPDGQWKYEIDDFASWLVKEQGLERAKQRFAETGASESQLAKFGTKAGFSGPLTDSFVHPSLYEAYPDLKNARVAFVSRNHMPDAGGQYFAPHGDQPEMVRLRLDAERGPGRSVMLHELQHAAQHREGVAMPSGAVRQDDGHRAYHHMANEVQARAVQARRDLTPEQRRARAPWLDYDVPENEQIVRFR